MDRTLETSRSDLRCFRAEESKIKTAKYFNNVVDECIFNVPIDQVNKLFSACFYLTKKFVNQRIFCEQFHRNGPKSCSKVSHTQQDTMSITLDSDFIFIGSSTSTTYFIGYLSEILHDAGR